MRQDGVVKGWGSWAEVKVLEKLGGSEGNGMAWAEVRVRDSDLERKAGALLERRKGSRSGGSE